MSPRIKVDQEALSKQQGAGQFSQGIVSDLADTLLIKSRMVIALAREDGRLKIWGSWWRSSIITQTIVW
ncbi:hypothetical protein HBI56_089040 [Parastagonospora nodorum]|uniref:Uncharacterized protein n=1 Tax=Phaeosphaeria nodorum (strain SN15 / ATCC MYA-4574 / FGSC 10173) TaxID=321614 RepID=A0A7U2FDM1_PHANO|nr:hypothetical protein HBH56_110420 [Parastagonospora nodorum]QRD03338.1 hypothetical protein JI435_419380 [Parastagonospora nodorum SN15]KAH3925469.1 hypothetical protein HBH54_179920 [Parastagonospora nodorum]KAH3951245.1 hypothetical protein HBH53_066120 [Parastagonospora nodorum]KAH3974223.1 hypothetical protein HBH51_092120 [Parastagonospora nodorum]